MVAATDKAEPEKADTQGLEVHLVALEPRHHLDDCKTLPSECSDFYGPFHVVVSLQPQDSEPARAQCSLRALRPCHARSELSRPVLRAPNVDATVAATTAMQFLPAERLEKARYVGPARPTRFPSGSVNCATTSVPSGFFAGPITRLPPSASAFFSAAPTSGTPT